MGSPTLTAEKVIGYRRYRGYRLKPSINGPQRVREAAMADMKQDLKSVDDQQNYSMGNSSDPKNMQELTQHVSNKTSLDRNVYMNSAGAHQTS